VYVKRVTDSPISGRNDERLPVHNEAGVTDKGLVQNPVNHITVVGTALRQSLQRGSLSGSETFHPKTLLIGLIAVKNNFKSGLVQAPLLRFNTSPLYL
jgi:hypothetical protein